MIFRRRKKDEAVTDSTPDETAAAPGDTDDTAAEVPSGDADTDSATPAGDDPEAQLAALDAQDWRAAGPYDITEVSLDEDEGDARIDLGGMIITGVPGAELRLQVAEDTQQIVSAMLLVNESALELGVYAAPRSRGYWAELRSELIDDTLEAGGSAALAEGPFGVELRRLIPVQTPDGQQGYQPSRMWVVEGPRWLLRGIIYGQSALDDEADVPEELIEAFRQVIVRRGPEAIAPGEPLPLRLPAGLQPVESA
jgi:hypothetical protein